MPLRVPTELHWPYITAWMHKDQSHKRANTTIIDILHHKWKAQLVSFRDQFSSSITRFKCLRQMYVILIFLWHINMKTISLIILCFEWVGVALKAFLSKQYFWRELKEWPVESYNTSLYESGTVSTLSWSVNIGVSVTDQHGIILSPAWRHIKPIVSLLFSPMWNHLRPSVVPSYDHCGTSLIRTTWTTP